MSKTQRPEVTAQPEELEMLAELRGQAEQLLAGARMPSGAWLLANYLDLAEAFAAERRTRVYREARQWVTGWANRRENIAELERLAARSWAMRRLNEQRMKADERALERVVEVAKTRRKRPFVNAREEMAFVERTVQAHLRKRVRAAGASAAAKDAQGSQTPLRTGTNG